MTFNPVSRSKVRVTIDLWENLNPAQVFSALTTFIHRVCVCVLVVKKYKINLNQVSRWKEYMYICVCDCMLLVQNIFFLKQGCWLSKIWHFSIACHFLNYRRIKLLGSIWFYMTKCWQLENTCYDKIPLITINSNLNQNKALATFSNKKKALCHTELNWKNKITLFL